MKNGQKSSSAFQTRFLGDPPHHLPGLSTNSPLTVITNNLAPPSTWCLSPIKPAITAWPVSVFISTQRQPFCAPLAPINLLHEVRCLVPFFTVFLAPASLPGYPCSKTLSVASSPLPPGDSQGSFLSRPERHLLASHTTCQKGT